jgi:hypothetical protein
MTIRLTRGARGACRRHRLTLAELAERRSPTVDGGAALEHVEHCADCANVLGELMLTVVALRRLGEQAEIERAMARRFGEEGLALTTTAESDPWGVDLSWARLRERIERSRRAAREQTWRWRTSLGGLVASAMVVGALVGPFTINFTGGQGGDWTGTDASELDAISWQIEAAYVSDAHAAPIIETTSAGSFGVRRYPDGFRPVRKEVRPRGYAPQLNVR